MRLPAKLSFNEKGALPLLVLVVVVGLLAFTVVSNLGDFKNSIFANLFNKKSSHAAGLSLTATFNSIGVEYTTTAATGTLEYKKQTDVNWKTALPLWQAGGALYGSVLLAQSGTTYDVRVTPQGGVAVTGTVSTRVDNIPNASALTPTHFVNATSGNDANTGTATAPWKTLGKAAAAAPANAVVQVGPGSYTARNLNNTDKVQFTRPITLIAQFPALDDNRNEINLGQHSIIESGNFTSPGGSSWTVKPVAGCTFYQWDSGVNDTFNLGYASTRSELPKRIAKWDRKGSASTTVDNFLTLMCTNKTYNYGFITDGTTIYARLPKDINPNTVYVSTNAGLVNLHGPNIRISGFELRQGSFETDAAANFAILDHNLIGMGNFYMPAGRDGQTNPPTLYYGGDHLVQYNKVMEYGIWSNDPNNKAIHWDFIKTYITKADGSQYDANRLGANSEGTGFMGGSGGAKRVVARYNTLDGGFNGLAYYNVGYDRYATQDHDIHDNIFKHIGDDAFEPEQVGINWRIWNNRIENAGVILSTGPLAYGPVYLFRNQGFRNGYYDGSGGLGAIFFKYSGGSNPMARIYVINNTFWSDNNSDGGNQYAGGGPGSESFYLRNNIMHSQRYAFKPPTYNSLQWDESNNYFSSTGTSTTGCTKASCGLEAYGAFTTDVAGYRAAYQTGTGGRTTNSNVGWNSTTGVGNFNYNPGVWFTNVSAGDLSLTSTAPFVDTGAVVPNISECFAGAGPDLGAIELGTPTTCSLVPATPLPLPTPTPAPILTGPTPTPVPFATPTPIPAPIVGESVVKIFAWGKTDDGVYPTMQLMINDVVVATYSDVNFYTEYTYNSPTKVTASQVKVAFINDLANRDLVVDKINVDGIDYQSESPSTYSLGSYTTTTGCAGGYKAQETLHCNGYFAYSGGTIAPTPTPTPAPVPVGDVIAPTVSITSPLNNSTVSRGTRVTVSASAFDNVGITKVELRVNNSLICTDTFPAYSCSWSVPNKPNRTYTLQAKAFDAANNSSTSSVSVTAR